eukprot:Skav228844  [mRNA]  locus=scaffold4680:184793:188141:+ [translate_table: standard]
MGVDALTEVLSKRKPKTRRGKKILKDREPKVTEDAKTAMIIRGARTSNDMTTLLRELHLIRSPLAMLYMRKHEEHPFEDHSVLHFGHALHRLHHIATFWYLFVVRRTPQRWRSFARNLTIRCSLLAPHRRRGRESYVAFVLPRRDQEGMRRERGGNQEGNEMEGEKFCYCLELA